MSTSGSSSNSRGKLPNTAALLMDTKPRSSSSSRRSLRPLSAESLSSMGTSSSSTGSVLPNTMKLLMGPATLVSPRPRSPGSPRRRSPRARSSGSPRRSSSPGSPQPPGWYRASRSPKLGHRSRSRSRSPSRSRHRSRSSSGWSSASPVFRRLKFTIKNKGDGRATVFRVPMIAPPPAGALRRRHTYRRPTSSSESPVFRRLKFTIKNKGDGRATVFRVPRIAPPPAGALRRRHYRSPYWSSSSSSSSFSSWHPTGRAAHGSPKGAKAAAPPAIPLKSGPAALAAALAAARSSPKGATGAKNRSSSSSFDSSN